LIGALGSRLKVPAVVLTALIVQTALLAHLHVIGIAPDLMLGMAVAGGICGGPVRGATMGFAAGMAIDLFLQTPLGLSALVFSLVGYAVGCAHTAVLRSSWWIPGLTTLVASAAGEALYAVAATVVGERNLVTGHLAVVVAVVAVENTVLAALVIPTMAWSFGRPRSTRLDLL